MIQLFWLMGPFFVFQLILSDVLGWLQEQAEIADMRQDLERP